MNVKNLVKGAVYLDWQLNYSVLRYVDFESYFRFEMVVPNIRNYGHKEEVFFTKEDCKSLILAPNLAQLLWGEKYA